jgi:hypothetical protein
MPSGVCKALDGAPIEGTSETLKANPLCVCITEMAAMFCPVGHMLECHYPLRCSVARCSHYQRTTLAETDLE